MRTQPDASRAVSGAPTRRLLICTDLDPRHAAEAGAVSGLALGGLRDRGWECLVIGPAWPAAIARTDDALERDASCERIALPSTPLRGDVLHLVAPAYASVAAAVARFRPELVLCETELVAGWMGRVAALRAGIPLVSSYLAQTIPVRWWPARAELAGAARFHRASRRVLTPTRAARETLRQMGLAATDTWGQAVDAAQFTPAHRSLATRTAFGWHDRFTLLHAGPATAAEMRVLFEAYRLAAGLLPGDALRLALIGGDQARRVRSAAPPGVSFLGRPERRAMLPVFYASADAFVSTSTAAASAPWVLEAMASGLPALVTAGGASADAVRDGKDGLVFRAGDAAGLAHAIVKLALTPPLRHRLSIAARNTAMRHRWKAQLDLLADRCAEVGWRPAVTRSLPNRDDRRVADRAARG